jgi:hypothetical protein
MAILGFFVVALSMEMTDTRSGSIVAVWGMIIGVLAIVSVRGNVTGQTITTSSIAMVVFLGLAFLMQQGPLAMDEYPVIPENVLPPPPDKKLFVGSFAGKGFFVVVASAIMIFLADSFFGVGWFTLKVFGAGAKLNIADIYSELHSKLGLPSAREHV